MDNYSAHDFTFAISQKNTELLNQVLQKIVFDIENSSFNNNVEESFRKIMINLMGIVEDNDPYTQGHSERVKNYSLLLGIEMGLSGSDMFVLELASILHDIGKIAVSDEILSKKTTLTDREYEEIKRHPVYGEQILRHISYLKNVIDVVKQHHEHFDGNGYPMGIKGKEISLIARIISVADSYDAMTSERHYKLKQNKDYALRELKECSGTQFDPEVVDAFCKLINNEG